MTHHVPVAETHANVLSQTLHVIAKSFAIDSVHDLSQREVVRSMSNGIHHIHQTILSDKAFFFPQQNALELLCYVI